MPSVVKRTNALVINMAKDIAYRHARVDEAVKGQGSITVIRGNSHLNQGPETLKLWESRSGRGSLPILGAIFLKNYQFLTGYRFWWGTTGEPFLLRSHLSAPCLEQSTQ